jgi:hypothetical protein
MPITEKTKLCRSGKRWRSEHNSVHDAKLHRGKLSRPMRYVICLFRILVSKDVLAICLERVISSFFHEKRKPLSGTILRW